jgi:hypothetical protein
VLLDTARACLEKLTEHQPAMLSVTFRAFDLFDTNMFFCLEVIFHFCLQKNRLKLFSEYYLINQIMLLFFSYSNLSVSAHALWD